MNLKKIKSHLSALKHVKFNQQNMVKTPLKSSILLGFYENFKIDLRKNLWSINLVFSRRRER